MAKPDAHGILKFIRERAAHEIGDIREESSRTAETIRENAAREAENLRENVRLKIRNQTGQLRERYSNMRRFQHSVRTYEVKSQAITAIWREVEELLLKVEQSDGYGKILENLFFECLDVVPDGSIVRAASGDAELIGSLIERSKRLLNLEEDPGVHGGVEFYWPDGRTVLRNTLLHRLGRLKAGGNAGLTKILFAREETSS